MQPVRINLAQTQTHVIDTLETRMIESVQVSENELFPDVCLHESQEHDGKCDRSGSDFRNAWTSVSVSVSVL